MKDISVNMKNLLYRILLSWRLLLVLALVFAILANCYGVYKEYKARGTSKPLTQENSLGQARADAESAKRSLTEREVRDVEAAVNTYYRYEKRFKAMEEYMDQSELMKLDYQSVPTASLRYLIDEHYVVEYPVIEKDKFSSDIAYTYAELLADGETITLLSEALGVKTEIAKELISVYSYSDHFLCVDVIGTDQSQCKQMVEIIKNQVNKLEKNKSGTFPSYDMKLVSEKYLTRTDEGVYDRQLKKINDLNSMRTGRMNIQSGMSDAQKKYFSAQMEYLDKIYNQERGELVEEDVRPEEHVTPKIGLIQKKMLIVGFAAGLATGCLLVIFSYTLTPVIRVKENLTEGMKQTVLGTVWTGNGKKKPLSFIDRLITKWFYGREMGFELDKRLEMLSAGIDISLENSGIKNIYLTGASDRNANVIKELQERLGKKYQVKSGECIAYNPESLHTLSEMETVVFVETVGDSRYEEVLREIELAKQSKTQVLGFVLLQG